MGKKILWKSFVPINYLVFKISLVFICIQQKKEIQVWNNLRVRKSF